MQSHSAISAHRDAAYEGGMGGDLQQSPSPKTVKTDQLRAWPLRGGCCRHLLLRASLDADWSEPVGGGVCLLVRAGETDHGSLHSPPCDHSQNTDAGGLCFQDLVQNLSLKGNVVNN